MRTMIQSTLQLALAVAVVGALAGALTGDVAAGQAIVVPAAEASSSSSASAGAAASPIVTRAGVATTALHTVTPAPGATAVQASFVHRNAGDTPIRIVDVKTDCGCSKVAVEPRDVPPGETFTVDVTIDIDVNRLTPARKAVILYFANQREPAVVDTVAIDRPRFVRLTTSSLTFPTHGDAAATGLPAQSSRIEPLSPTRVKKVVVARTQPLGDSATTLPFTLSVIAVGDAAAGGVGVEAPMPDTWTLVAQPRPDAAGRLAVGRWLVTLDVTTDQTADAERLSLILAVRDLD